MIIHAAPLTPQCGRLAAITNAVSTLKHWNNLTLLTLRSRDPFGVAWDRQGQTDRQRPPGHLFHLLVWAFPAAPPPPHTHTLPTLTFGHVHRNRWRLVRHTHTMQQQSARQTRAVFQRTQFAWVLRHQHGCVRPDWLRAPQRHQQPVCGLRRQHAPGASALGSAASHQHSGLRETTGSSIRQGQQHSQHPQHQLGLDDAGADSPAAAMRAFLAAYGVPEPDIRRLAAECPELFGLRSSSSSSSCGCSPYETGRVLLLLHAMGWTHAQVLQRIMRIYPQVCCALWARDVPQACSASEGGTCAGAGVDGAPLFVRVYPASCSCCASTSTTTCCRCWRTCAAWAAATQTCSCW
jgi:hypothetical protein